MICELFQVFCDRNICPPGQRAEIRERIASESLQKTVQNSMKLQDMCE